MWQRIFGCRREQGSLEVTNSNELLPNEEPDRRLHITQSLSVLQRFIPSRGSLLQDFVG